MKILVTGNPNYGLAEGIKSHMGGDYISRSNGYDLCSDEGRNKAVEKSLEYNVFINNAALWRFNQTILLEKVWDAWKTNNHKGHIINIGSTADIIVRGTNWIYPNEKKALKAQSRNLSTLSTWDCPNIRVTYIAFGSIDTPKVREKHPDRLFLTVDDASNTIKWVIDSPKHISINEISLDRIQSYFS